MTVIFFQFLDTKFISIFLWKWQETFKKALVAQLVKNLPAMWKTWVWSLGWEDPLEKEKLPVLVFWPGEFHGLYSPWGHKWSDMTERLSLFTLKKVNILWDAGWRFRHGFLGYRTADSVRQGCPCCCLVLLTLLSTSSGTSWELKQNHIPEEGSHTLCTRLGILTQLTLRITPMKEVFTWRWL